jgi:hypothetical protein
MLFTLTFLLISACTPDSGPSSVNFSDQEIVTGEQPEPPTELTRETGAGYVESSNGYWLHYSQSATCVDVGSQSFDNINRSLYLLEMAQDDFGVLIESWQACDLELSPVLNLLPVIKEANYDAIYPVVTEGGLFSSTNIGGGYSSGPFIELWGLNLDNPLMDPVPTDVEDPAIYDADEDGFPGATLVFGTNICEAYVAQRTITHFIGNLVTYDRIEGISVMKTKQLVIDANTSFCRTSYSTRSNDLRNHFSRQRIDGQGGSLDLDTDGDGSITCDEIQGDQPSFSFIIEALFERIELDDHVCL